MVVSACGSQGVFCRGRVRSCRGSLSTISPSLWCAITPVFRLSHAILATDPPKTVNIAACARSRCPAACPTAGSTNVYRENGRQATS